MRWTGRIIAARVGMSLSKVVWGGALVFEGFFVIVYTERYFLVEFVIGANCIF
jgi:hypothetical protein